MLKRLVYSVEPKTVRDTPRRGMFIAECNHTGPLTVNTPSFQKGVRLTNNRLTSKLDKQGQPDREVFLTFQAISNHMYLFLISLTLFVEHTYSIDRTILRTHSGAFRIHYIEIVVRLTPPI